MPNTNTNTNTTDRDGAVMASTIRLDQVTTVMLEQCTVFGTGTPTVCVALDLLIACLSGQPDVSNVDESTWFPSYAEYRQGLDNAISGNWKVKLGYKFLLPFDWRCCGPTRGERGKSTLMSGNRPLEWYESRLP
jgi:hypothetical protein